MDYRTLISAEQLIELGRQSAPVIVLDCGFELTDPPAGRRAFEAQHVAGANYLHLDDDLAGAKTGDNGRHPLPDRARWAARVGALGIAPGVQVVCYDGQGGPYAARAWWLLRWLGHDAVAVLDGGLAAWLAAGGPVDSGAAPAVDAAAPPYPAADAAAMPTVDAGSLLSSLGRVRIVDARAGERFRGEVEPLDPVAGRIPGATQRFKDNLQADGRFKPAAQLQQEFAALGLDAAAGAPVVQQCGSGVTACHNLLAMAHAGFGDTLLYPGSWSEWCADPARPVARG